MAAAAEAADSSAEPETAAAETMAAARWPGGVLCPSCAGRALPLARASRGRPAWRCRACRAEFTVTSGTRLHASKAPLSAWVAAAVDGADSPAVSDKTARRLRRTAESTGLAAGPARLAALLAAEPEPPGSPKQQGPLDGIPAAQRRILAMLRTRAAGATPALIAAETGLSFPHVRRSLRALRTAGLASDSAATVMWGYRPQRITQWRIADTERAVAARPQMGWAPPPPEGTPTAVPAEFWWLFWSGTCASELRLPEDALHIADTLIGGPDPAARAWALETLPPNALRELRAMTGYDTGPAACRLDTALAHRELAHNPATDRTGDSREPPSSR